MDTDLQPTEYKPYQGGYDKTFYDIKAKDGKEYKNCWPNAGNFFPSQGNRVVLGEEVLEFRKAKDNFYKL